MRAVRTDIELETIVRRIMDGEVDLQPEFQRGEIWDEKRRQRLIDTILRQWYVPAVHIVQEEDRELVLDGQQRLATIRDFFTGKIVIDGRIDPQPSETSRFHGMRFADLPPETQRAMRRFPLPVVYLTNHTPGEPNELFFRLNQSYNLTPPEKRNALHGPARNQVKDLVREMQDWGLLRKEIVGFDNQRLAYDDILARVSVAVEQGTLRRHINNNTVEEFYRAGEFAADTIDDVRQAGRALMQQIAAPTRFKFNKGTLQTWLLYCYWAPRSTGPLPPTLLYEFEDDRQRLKKRSESGLPADRRRLLTIIGVYDDRASYRVTDVSSVVARDLAIHLYSQATFDTPSRRGSRGLLEGIVNDRNSDPSAEIFAFMETSHWGEPMVGP